MLLAEAPLVVRQPAFTEAQARARAKVPAGPVTRAVAADLWVLTERDTTWLVGPDTLITVAGDAIPTVTTLNLQPLVRVQLYRGAASEDPRREHALLAQRGIEVEAAQEKGGTWGAYATITAQTLVPFLQHLAARKLRLTSGGRVEPM
jgi:hypothetical protein